MQCLDSRHHRIRLANDDASSERRTSDTRQRPRLEDPYSPVTYVFRAGRISLIAVCIA